jgi:TetR/AcrR family transcriptional regulator of autoinduction and epiphytic fitness
MERAPYFMPDGPTENGVATLARTVKEALRSPRMANVTGVNDMVGNVGARGRGESSTRTVSDGRTARSQRTRDSVVEALLDLLNDGNPRPTAREIAEHAGVSLRSVYVHFDDLEDLFLAAAGRHLERILPLLQKVPATGPLSDRLTAFTDRQGRLLEAIGPVQLASSLQEPFSPTIAEIRVAVRTAAHKELERVFGAELDSRTEPTRRHLLVALELASSSNAWDVMRSRERFDENEARSAMRETLASLLHVESE